MSQLRSASAGSDREFFVLYPRGARTGGPLALHQLVDELRRIGFQAHLVPFPGTEHLPDVPDYSEFDAPILAGTVPDRSTSVLIVPEAYVPLARKYRRAQAVVWWLSIDKSTTEMFRAARRRRELRDKLFWREYLGRARRDLGQLNRPANVRFLRHARHIAQSEYARAYLNRQYGFEAPIVSDYTYPAMPAPERQFDTPAQTLRIAFNPMKGGTYIASVRPRFPGVEWVELVGMTTQQVSDVLQTCHVYLDLGFHPGKDRIPREAALAGCVVISRAIGAAAFHADMPLPDSAKVGADVDVNEVVHAIQLVEGDLERAYRAQAGYREWIVDERARFSAEVREAFEGRRDPLA